MNLALALIAAVVAVNPPRRRDSLSTDDTATVAMGAALCAALLAALAAVASPLIDSLQVSSANLRIAVGLVLAVVGIHDLVWRRPDRGAALPGRRAALVPVFFPVLARPELGLLALGIGADHGVWWSLVAATVAMVAVVGWHALATPQREKPVFSRIERGAGRVVSAAAVAVALAIAGDGVFAI